MLLLEARGKKILTGILSESGKVLFKELYYHNKPLVFSHLTKTLQNYDKNFIPKKIWVTITPGNPKTINESILFAKVKAK